MQKVGQEKIAPYLASIIRSTQEEEDLFQRHMLDWHKEGISLWSNLLEGKGYITENYIKILRRIWYTFPFDVIVHWGENGAVTRFIEEYPVTRIAMELGCTRAPFFESAIMDPFGTNGASVVPKLKISDIREIVGGHEMSSHEAVMVYSQNLETVPYEQQFSMMSSDISKNLFSRDRLAFLPLQLYDDANLLRFSQYKTLTEVVLDVVPKLAENGYTVIVKPHPASKFRPSAAVANALAQASIKRWSQNVVWLDRQDSSFSNTHLIRICDFVVTVNSSVGFEALYFDKPVVVMGDAIYKPKELFPTIDDVISSNFDEEFYRKNIGYLRRYFLGGYLQPEYIRSNKALFCERISLIHGLHEQYPNDPLGFARNYWRSISPGWQSLNRGTMFSGRSKPGVGEFGVPQLPLESGKINVVATDGITSDCAPYLMATLRFIGLSKSKDPESFADWLHDLLSEQGGIEQFVDVGDFLDSEFYLNSHEDLKLADVDPKEHFLSWGFAEGRVAHPSLPASSIEDAISCIIRTASLILSNNPLPDYPLDQDQEMERQAQIEDISRSLNESSHKIAVVAHLYYADLVPDLLKRLEAITEPFDFIVTLPDWGTRRIVDMVRSSYPDAIFYRSANRGRDIGPFMDLLPIIIAKEYDALLKIQTKRGYYIAGRYIPELGDLWREETFRELLGSPERVTEIISCLRNNSDVNMVGPRAYYMSLEHYPYHDQGYLARILFGESSGAGFFAGTMFWTRPKCLKKISDIIGLTNFAPETGANDGAIAHLVERFFGHAASLHDGRIYGASNEANDGLLPDLEPNATRIHDHLTQSLRVRKEEREVSREALVW
ncbi:rhamnan synthesis F family protein [Sphingobium sp. MP9-4]|uniref:rhamnan synthesis F family protein n=1 Tax=Sphingobium sp. MP9-4 TaxID=1761936 RepID=UPI0019CFFF9E|nr:rhamnan synthesis F family protein [Sphingobium sp. MP9-4]